MPPECLERQGFLQAIDGVVVRPPDGRCTYQSGAAESVIGYFVVSVVLLPLVDVCFVLEGAPVRKHSRCAVRPGLLPAVLLVALCVLFQLPSLARVAFDCSVVKHLGLARCALLELGLLP